MGLLMNMVYLGMGIEEEIHEKVTGLISKGRELTEGEDILDVFRGHIKKRKNQMEKLLFRDMELATKKDIEELKKYIDEKFKKDT